MVPRAFLSRIAVTLITLLALPAVAQLTPPAGPVTDSFKNLDEVEPRIPLNQGTAPGDASNIHVISQPGSYYLTGDIITSVLKTVIFIDTPGNVSLDLSGYTIEHVVGLNEPLIDVSSNVESCIIRNGFLRGGVPSIVATVGVPLFVNATLRIENMEIGSGSSGIVSDRVTHVRDTIIRNATRSGIRIQGISSNGSTVQRTVILSTNEFIDPNLGGIQITENARITDVTISDTFGPALITGNGAIIRGLSVLNYGYDALVDNGITIGSESKISDSLIRNYIGTGNALLIGSNSEINNITVFGAPAGTGIDLDLKSALVDSYVGGALTGVNVGIWCTIKNNNIEVNSGLQNALIAFGANVIDSNRFLGKVTFSSSNVVTRNTVAAGSFVSTGLGNSIGPINDLTSPWTNFAK